LWAYGEKTVDLHTVTGSFFNTENTITAACTPLLLDRAMSMCDYYDHLLSKTAPGSDVWRINQARGIPVEVSEHTINILKLALEMYDVSGGRFNIAIGSVMALWNFNSRNGDLPAPEALAATLGSMDCRQIRLSDRSVHVPDGMQIDLGGIAKGYVADRIAEDLRKNGVESALINLGGNIITIGQKPDGAPWRIGLQVPFTEQRYRDKFWSVIDCTNESIVTSGSYERGFYKDGRWYYHIIDPETGMPADNNVLSVTVCAPSSFLADALTTPLFLLGEFEGMNLADRYGVDAAYYLQDNRVIISAGMKTRL
jgi:thiamine biosynthesis lipoprotein